MRELFDKLRQNGEVAIEALVVERAQEGLQLDFKLKSDPSRPSLSDGDKRTLGEALSGFSNSVGGLLIYGVDCRVGEDGVDCAQRADPIPQIDRFHSLIADLIGPIVQPRLEGVELAVIHSTRSPGSGYLAVYVEKSERRPHRSVATGHGKYFRRAGKSFFPLEHYEIVDMLSRTGSPKLSLQKQYGAPQDHGEVVVRFLTLELYNNSPYIAKFPYLIIEGMVGFNHIAKHMNENLYKFHKISNNGVVMFSAGSDIVIHPGMSYPVGQIASGIYRGANHRWETRDPRSIRGEVYFNYRYGCEGMNEAAGRETNSITNLSIDIKF